MLPCTVTHEIDPLFESDKDLLGMKLHAQWGSLAPSNFRVREEVVGYYPTSVEAIQAAERRAEETISLLREIVTRNRNGFANEQKIEKEVEL
jgi:hypothetical protein